MRLPTRIYTRLVMDTQWMKAYVGATSPPYVDNIPRRNMRVVPVQQFVDAHIRRRQVCDDQLELHRVPVQPEKLDTYALVWIRAKMRHCNSQADKRMLDNYRWKSLFMNRTMALISAGGLRLAIEV